MNILITIDDNYLDIAMDMLYSLKLNNKKLTIHLIYDNLSKESIDKLSYFIKENKIGILKSYYFDSRELDLSVIKNDYITTTCYFRLFAPFIIEDVDRLLYLDPDIVCQKNIEELYNIDLEDKIIAGSINMLKRDVMFLKEIICNTIRIPIESDYINSGMLLIDTKKYREFISINTLKDFLKENKNILEYQDQDAINILFNKKIKIVDNNWNYQINAADWWNIHLDNAIIHYSESKKPWKEDYDDTYRAMPYYNLLYKKGEYHKLQHLLSIHSKNESLHILNTFLKEKY